MRFQGVRLGGRVLSRLDRRARDLFFFFQAEDGIRDYKVTGVQTCALPICSVPSSPAGQGAGPASMLSEYVVDSSVDKVPHNRLFAMPTCDNQRSTGQQHVGR